MDGGNNRILVFALPITDGANATNVLGQTNYTNNGPVSSVNGSTFQSPTGKVEAFAANGIALADQGRARILIWNDLSTVSNTQSADWAYGQADLTSGEQLSPLGVSYSSMRSPRDVLVDGGRVMVADYANHRMLFWNSEPTATGASANIAIGQSAPSAQSPNAGGSASSTGFNFPAGAAFLGGSMYVSDTANNRLLKWNSLPTAAMQPADAVIGQGNFTSTSTGQAAFAMNAPAGLSTDGTRLVLADMINHRVTIFNTAPVNAGSADVVVGQAAFATPSTACTSANTSSPSHALIYGGKLIVSDGSHHRVLIWNSVPTSNGVAADIVIGQSGMTGCSQNGGGAASALVMKFPRAVAVDAHGRLYVVDGGNSRILIWNEIPTANGEPADLVIGQANFNGDAPNGGGLSADSLNNPWGLTIKEGQMWIGDTGNHRVVRRGIPPL